VIRDKIILQFVEKESIFAAQSKWKAVRVVYGARLESVYTSKGYQEFESLAFRNI
jgi:hypothetical protein